MSENQTTEPFERDTGQVTLSDEAANEIAEMLNAIERDGLTYQQREASRRIRDALDRMNHQRGPERHQ